MSPARNSHRLSPKLFSSGGSTSAASAASGPVAPLASSAPMPMHTSISAYLGHHKVPSTSHSMGTGMENADVSGSSPVHCAD